MAKTATERRSSPTRRARSAAGKAERSPRSAAKKASAARTGSAKKMSPTRAAKATTAAKAAKSATSSGLAGKAARKVVAALARKALKSGAQAIKSAADRAGAVSSEAVEAGMSKRLPIQVSVDVAVPLSFAWEEWMTFDALHEGVHRIEDVERDGDRLTGHTAGPGGSEWEAEVVDERHEESFAWRSTTGSDCAGLATFHRLSERLTRIELDLDVLPTDAGETLTLALHLAHRHAEAELRRFKARVEFINPDEYEQEERDREQPSHNGSEPASDGDQ